MYPIQFTLDGVHFEIVADGAKQHPRQLEASKADFLLQSFDVLGGPAETCPTVEDESGEVIEDWDPETSDDPIDRFPSDLLDDDEYDLPDYNGGENNVTQTASDSTSDDDEAVLFPGA